jgi:hypothetical protein
MRWNGETTFNFSSEFPHNARCDAPAVGPYKRFSLQFTLTFSNWSASRTTLGLGKERDEEEEVFEKEK